MLKVSPQEVSYRVKAPRGKWKSAMWTADCSNTVPPYVPDSATAIKSQVCLMEQQHEEYVEATSVKASTIWAVRPLSLK